MATIGEMKRQRSAKRVRHLLDRIAYASLALDIAIALITVASLSGNILNVVDYALTAVVIISILLFVVLLFLLHYEKVLDAYYGVIRTRR